MAGITVESGKFAVYASTVTDDSNPYELLKVAEDGGACILQANDGRWWIFYIVANGANYDLRYYYSDDGGVIWSSSALIKAGVCQGKPGAVEVLAGRIVVYYVKTVVSTDYLYRSYSEDGGTSWTEEQVIT